MNNVDTMDIFNEVVGRHMGGKLIPITKYDSPAQNFTPQWVVKDMIALLPDQVWNENTTFLDISCKTGVFLIEIYKKLDEVLATNPKYADKQINADKHSDGPFSLARVNALHSQLNRYWPQGSSKLPATKYIDLYTMFFWWLQKRSNLTTEQKVDEL